MGRRYAVIFCLFSLPYTWFVCPVCQWPNRGEMQIVPWEQRYKNYVDRTYHLYDDADRVFYDTLTSDERVNQLAAELDALEQQHLKKIEDQVTEFTTTGKMANSASST